MVGLFSRFIEWWASEEIEDDPSSDEDDEDEDGKEKAREELSRRQIAALGDPPPLRSHNRPPAPQTLEPGRAIHVFESRLGPLWAKDGPLEARCGLKTNCGGRDLEWTVLTRSEGPTSDERTLNDSTLNDSTLNDSTLNRSTLNRKVGVCETCACCATSRDRSTPYPAIVAPSQILAPTRSSTSSRRWSGGRGQSPDRPSRGPHTPSRAR